MVLCCWYVETLRYGMLLLTLFFSVWNALVRWCAMSWTVLRLATYFISIFFCYVRAGATLGITTETTMTNTTRCTLCYQCAVCDDFM